MPDHADRVAGQGAEIHIRDWKRNYGQEPGDLLNGGRKAKRKRILNFLAHYQQRAFTI